MDYQNLHEESLRQNQPKLYQSLQESGQLREHLDEVGRSASALHADIVSKLEKDHPFSQKEYGTKAEWRGWLNQVAREIVLQDRVLAPDEETEQAQKNGYTD